MIANAIKTDLTDILKTLKTAFKKTPFPDIKQRQQDLKKLKALLLDNQDALIDAMHKDFGNRSSDDSKIGDILTTVQGLNYTLNHLKKWMKPSKRHLSMLMQPATARVEFQPLGVVGIIVPWNYPIFLGLGPLTTALAAGNRAMIKMSEYTPNTGRLLKQLVDKYFEPNKISIIEGDVSVAAAFSSLAFDHLFFTGSTNVGKLVMRAASENLVPVTLELGGKSPAIIADDMNIDTAVERFILGKTLNSGQTCVAPDYIFCPKGKTKQLIEAIETRFKSMYPSVKGNKDYTSIVNDAQHTRLQGLVDDAANKGAVITQLSSDNGCAKTRQMPLTLLLGVNDDMKVMQQEIFGPLLPILEYEDLDQAIEYINNGERPLALYIYSFDKAFQNKILKNTHSGGVCINDAAFHVAAEDLPFGGVGSSGMGSYHGNEGFKTFSHAKSILSRGRINFGTVLFPPFGKAIHNLIYKLYIR
ncbi:MAG: coniferyl-aldehyde dehydrogenase [Paraglaciecola sp.]|jgi:coniferyl-aldehyde dehydrogenase